MRRAIGLRPVPGGIFASTLSPYLFLQPTVPSFEYPRSDLPPQVHFVGPLLPPAPADFVTPSWFGGLTGRPVVLVTQGTVATDPTEVILPALEALRDEDVHVVAVTGGPDPEALGPVPANARVERYVPFAALMPHVSAYITNGGYGGLHYALAHGVPVVSVGKTEDKAELAARVSWSGVGVGMKSQVARPERLRAAVRTLLSEPGVRRAGGGHAGRDAAPTAGRPRPPGWWSSSRARGPSRCASRPDPERARHSPPPLRAPLAALPAPGPPEAPGAACGVDPSQLADRDLGLDGLPRRPRQLARLDRVLHDPLRRARHVVGAGVRPGATRTSTRRAPRNSSPAPSSAPQPPGSRRARRPRGRRGAGSGSPS